MYTILILLLVSLFNNNVLSENNSDIYYCKVKIDGPGITFSNFSKKEDYPAYDITSNFTYNTTAIKFRINNDGKWIHDSCSKFINEPILDKRWENFIHNKFNGTSMIFEAIKSFLNKSCNVFLSIYDISNNEKNLNKNKWNHLKINSSDDKIYKYENEQFEILNTTKNYTDILGQPHNFWKLQNSTFLYTNYSVNATKIYNKSSESCIILSPKICIYFYVAMCKNCNLTMQIQDENRNENKSFVASDTNNSKWKFEEFCIENITVDCFNISIYTNNVTNGFWAISDEGYVTNYPNSYCETSNNKRYIKLGNVTKHEKYKELTCETSDNEQIAKHFEIEIEKCVNPTTETVEETVYYGYDNNSRKMQKNYIGDKIEQASFDLQWLVPILVIVIITLITVIATIIYYIKEKSEKRKLSNSRYVVHYTPLDPEVKIHNFETSIVSTAEWASIEYSKFPEYAQSAFYPDNNNINILQKQFDDLPVGYLKVAYEGVRECNKNKNRFLEIVPYDENRVKLDKNSDSDSTDYINASYIRGVNYGTEYIIAQNPLENTVSDFWRMIWKENVTDIIMITITDEKYHKYWPDCDKLSFNGIAVDLRQLDVYEFYERRLFEVKNEGKTREINHLHFNSWPKQEEIISAHSFVDFFNRVLEIPHYHSSPVVIHCLGGIGRSGVITLCDIALRSVAVEGKINLFNITRDLRQYRANMVQNLKLYQLAHLIVVEMSNYRETAFDVNNFDLQVIDTHNLEEKWEQFLEYSKWIHEAVTPYKKCENFPNLNRYKDFLPVEQSRVVLQYKDPNYIHAMYVDGYRRNQRFIVAQQPLPNTLANFWIMILQNKVKIIISLNEIDTTNERYCLFFPNEENRIIQLEMRLEIRFEFTKNYQTYDQLTVNVYEGEKHTSTIVIIALKNWLKTMAVPNSAKDMVDIWKEVDNVKTKPQILICCDDGIRASGLVACFFYMTERMFQERKCDVVGSVRAVRRSHLSFINFEQFTFLNQCAVELGKFFFKK